MHSVRLPTPFPGNSVAQAFGKPARGTIFLFLTPKSKYPPLPTSLHNQYPHPPFPPETQQKTSTKKTLTSKKIQAPLSYIVKMKTKNKTSKTPKPLIYYNNYLIKNYIKNAIVMSELKYY